MIYLSPFVKGYKVKMAKQKMKAIEEVILEPKELEEISDLEILDESQDLPAPEVIQADTPETAALRTRVSELLRTVHTSYWELCATLGKIFDEQLYKRWSYPSFEDYLAQECNLEKTKGYALANIWKYVEKELPLKLNAQDASYKSFRDSVIECGWAKAWELAKTKIVTADNLEEVTEKIHGPLRELKDYVKEQKELQADSDDAAKNGRVETIKMVKVGWRVPVLVQETIQAAISKAKSILGPESKDERAVEMIFSTFDSENMLKNKKELPSFFKRLEQVTGHGIIVVDESQKILYGNETLNKLVEEVD